MAGKPLAYTPGAYTVAYTPSKAAHRVRVAVALPHRGLAEIVRRLRNCWQQWLDSERGAPVRVIVPEAYGFKSIKWLIIEENLGEAGSGGQVGLGSHEDIVDAELEHRPGQPLWRVERSVIGGDAHVLMHEPHVRALDRTILRAVDAPVPEAL